MLRSPKVVDILFFSVKHERCFLDGKPGYNVFKVLYEKANKELVFKRISKCRYASVQTLLGAKEEVR